MKFLFLSIVLLSTLRSIKCDGEEYANADFFTQQFYRLKQKYDVICQKRMSNPNVFTNVFKGLL